ARSAEPGSRGENALPAHCLRHALSGAAVREAAHSGRVWCRPAAVDRAALRLPGSHHRHTDGCFAGPAVAAPPGIAPVGHTGCPLPAAAADLRPTPAAACGARLPE